MKSLLAFTFGLAILSIAVSIPCESAELTIDAPESLPLKSEDFTATVSVKDVEGLKGYQLEIEVYYNAVIVSDLSVAASAEGTLFGDSDCISADIAGGRASMLRSGTVSGSGSLATFTIKCEPQAHGEYYLSIKAILGLSDESTIPWYCDPAPVRIGPDAIPTSPPPRAEQLEAAFIIPVPPSSGPKYCDVNGDGNVNILDIIAMMNMLGDYAWAYAYGRLRYADVNEVLPEGGG